MFNFFKRKESNKAVFDHLPIKTDIHSHILPGIDDGSPDIATSLKLVKGIYDLGIRKSVATPHVIGDLYRNTPETIGNALEKLKTACTEAGIDIELSAAAEYMLDASFMQLLRDKSPLLTIHKNFILTEQSYAVATSNLNEIGFELMTSGYKPIMAHPERYFFYHKNYDHFFQLKEWGFLLQVNLLSLTGYYGRPVTNAAKFILDNDLADLVGTDMHHERHLGLLQNKANLAIMHEYLGDNTFNGLTEL